MGKGACGLTRTIVGVFAARSVPPTRFLEGRSNSKRDGGLTGGIKTRQALAAFVLRNPSV